MKKGTFYIILAGVLWGSMGLFVRTLNSFGFTSVQIAALRMLTAAVVYCLMLTRQEKDSFRVEKRDIPLFLGLGLGSVLFFTVCYFTAIQMMSMSAAAILLYTSPVWVMLMSVVFFHERLTVGRLTALAIAFLGCVLVSGIGSGGLTPAGILVGLGAGIGYALYSILGTVALRRYKPLTVTTYTFVISGIGAFLLSQPMDLAEKAVAASSPLLWGLVVLSGLVTAVVPYLAYTEGLRHVEASKAAILATIEPMVATLLGMLVYREPLTLSSGLGVLCILSAIVILNL